MSLKISLNKTYPLTDPLCQYLVDKGSLTMEQWSLVRLQQEATGERLPDILTMMGFVPYDEIVKGMIQLDLEDLYLEESLSSVISSNHLISLNAMVVAEQGGHVFIASEQPVEMINAFLSQHYPELIVHFVPCKPLKLQSYLKRLKANTDDFKLLDSLLDQAAAKGVSDIHIVPKESSFLVLFRQHGVRFPVHEGTLLEYSYLSSRIKDKGSMDLAERRIPQDGSFAFRFESRQINLRIASMPTIHGETIVIRLLDPKSAAPKVSNLGITRLDHWNSSISRPNGLCIVCGPTGSGKSTTLNASLLELDRLGSSIYSLENPVEMRTPLVGQTQVNTKVGLGFEQGLRALMRMDPDVIVIGEIRDEATAKAAIQASESGHLVLATLHSHSILGALHRLASLGVRIEDHLYLIRGILAQRLVRTRCQECQAKGCAKCSFTGISGRTLVSECVYFNEELEVLSALNGKRDWPTMLEDAYMKREQGIVSHKELIRVFGAEVTDSGSGESNDSIV